MFGNRVKCSGQQQEKGNSMPEVVSVNSIEKATDYVQYAAYGFWGVSVLLLVVWLFVVVLKPANNEFAIQERKLFFYTAIASLVAGMTVRLMDGIFAGNEVDINVVFTPQRSDLLHPRLTVDSDEVKFVGDSYSIRSKVKPNSSIAVSYDRVIESLEGIINAHTGNQNESPTDNK